MVIEIHMTMIVQEIGYGKVRRLAMETRNIWQLKKRKADGNALSQGKLFINILKPGF
ncbi:MAG: hypothetical protein GY757_36970 [bacterium]|nr:hypothetical protein [bacterium]